jgi:hypothetical protein
MMHLCLSVSPDEAKTVWHRILEETLKGEDLVKLGAGIEGLPAAAR